MGGITPISVGFRDASDYWTEQGETYCKTAHTVTAGAFCDEPTVVSDACRSPSNSVDAFVCDDPKMAATQASLWGNVKNLVFTIVGVLAGRP